MFVALAVMIAARRAIGLLSPAWDRNGRMLDAAAALRRPFAYRRARACLALIRLRGWVQAWAAPEGV